jgi:hypothetical protein
MLIELFIAARLNSAANSLRKSEPLSPLDEQVGEMVDGWFWKLVDRAERRRALKAELDKE